MKRFAFSFILFLLIVACSRTMEPNAPDNGHKTNVVTKAEIDTSEKYSISTPVLFEEVDELNFWSQFSSLEERFVYFQVADSILNRITTDALVYSCAHYPLNYLIWTYNTEEKAVDLLFEKSSLHQELLQRPEAVSKLVKLFSKTTLAQEELSFTDERILERLILKLSDQLNTDDYLALSESLEKKAESFSRDADTLSLFMLEPLIELRRISHCSSDQQDFLSSLTAAYESRDVPSTIQHLTPFGHSVVVFLNEEMPSSMIAYLDNLFAQQYPNAQILRPSSYRYNCHSYAWISTGENNHYWLNAEYPNNNLQLSAYWTDDLYVTVQPEGGTQPLIVYYSDGDHSARFGGVANNTVYLVSKWGAGPLVKHTIADCPYTTTNLQLFAPRNDCLNTPAISGPSSVALGYPYYYSTPFQLQREWILEYEESNFSIDPILNCYDAYNCSVTMFESGVCKLWVKGYYNGTLVYQTNKFILSNDLPQPPFLYIQDKR